MCVRCQHVGSIIKDMLTKAIPINIPAKMGKSKLCESMVNVWAVFKPARPSTVHQTDDIWVEMTTRHEIHEADQVVKNFKTHKIPSHTMERKYLDDHGKKPPLKFCLCAKCGQMLVGKIPFNKDVACKDKKLDKKWKAD